MDKYTKDDLLRLGGITDQVFPRISDATYTSLMNNLLNEETQVEAIVSFLAGYIGDINSDEAKKVAFEEDRLEMPKYLGDPKLSKQIVAIWRLELGK